MIFVLQVVPSTPIVYSPTDEENSPKNFIFPEASKDQGISNNSCIKKEPKKQISSSSSSSENTPPTTSSHPVTAATTDPDLSDQDITLKDDAPIFSIATDSDSQTVTETKESSHSDRLTDTKTITSDETIVHEVPLTKTNQSLPKVQSDVHLTRVTTRIEPLTRVNSASDILSEPADIRIDIAPDEGLIFNHDSGIESVEVSPCPVTESNTIFPPKFDTVLEINEHVSLPKKLATTNLSDKKALTNHKQKLLLHPDRAKFVPEQVRLKYQIFRTIYNTYCIFRVL